MEIRSRPPYRQSASHFLPMFYLRRHCRLTARCRLRQARKDSHHARHLRLHSHLYPEIFHGPARKRTSKSNRYTKPLVSDTLPLLHRYFHHSYRISCSLPPFHLRHPLQPSSPWRNTTTSSRFHARDFRAKCLPFSLRSVSGNWMEMKPRPTIYDSGLLLIMHC